MCTRYSRTLAINTGDDFTAVETREWTEPRERVARPDRPPNGLYPVDAQPPRVLNEDWRFLPHRPPRRGDADDAHRHAWRPPVRAQMAARAWKSSLPPPSSPKSPVTG